MKKYIAYIGYNWTNDKDLMFLGVSSNKKMAMLKLVQIATIENGDAIETDDVMNGNGEWATDDGDRVYGISETDDLDADD